MAVSGRETQMMDLQTQLKEQAVLDSELGSLRKNADVYRQQQNSGIFFLSSVPKERSRCKKTTDALKKELKKLETERPCHTPS